VPALVLAFRAYPEVFDRRIFPSSGAASWIGLCLCAGGVAFAIWARRTLGTNWSGNPSIKEGHELVQSGPYRLARHPIYTGLIAAVLGTQLGGGRVRELVILLGSLAVVWVKIRVEERLMMRQFPAAYPRYRERTKALIPFVL
jgi:protein-S-isoprenylcysteine O-methyltransferase Ste14